MIKKIMHYQVDNIHQGINCIIKKYPIQGQNPKNINFQSKYCEPNNMGKHGQFGVIKSGSQIFLAFSHVCLYPPRCLLFLRYIKT